MEYEFNVGDVVVTTDGKFGYIKAIYNYPVTMWRGFAEPMVAYSDGKIDYITYDEAKNGFTGYKRIGKYTFQPEAKSNKTKKIEKLFPIPKYEKKMCKICTVKSTDYRKEDSTVTEGLVDILVGVEYPDNRVLMEKINEIIGHVNGEGE